AKGFDARVVGACAGRRFDDRLHDSARQAAADGREERAPHEGGDDEPPWLGLEPVAPPNEDDVGDDEGRHENETKEETDKKHQRTRASHYARGGGRGRSG